MLLLYPCRFFLVSVIFFRKAVKKPKTEQLHKYTTRAEMVRILTVISLSILTFYRFVFIAARQATPWLSAQKNEWTLRKERLSICQDFAITVAKEDILYTTAPILRKEVSSFLHSICYGLFRWPAVCKVLYLP